MSATALPLPLELTKPATLASDVDTQLRKSFGVGQYDPKTQMAVWSDVTVSAQQCQSIAFDGGVDAQVDMQTDDNDFN